MKNITTIDFSPEMIGSEENMKNKYKKYASVSNFFHWIIRECKEWKLFFELKKSQRDVRAGKYIKLNSLADLD